MSERELIERIQAGDQTAFEGLFHNHKAMVFNACFRMLGNRHEAEDVTQDVFFHAYKSIKLFRFESKLSSWLYRIALNRCLNHERKQRLARWLPLDLLYENRQGQANTLPTSADQRPDLSLERSEKERIVNEAINSLPKQQRTALLLHRYEGLSYQEIAAVMRCSVSSVESRLHRARVNLARRLLPMLKDI